MYKSFAYYYDIIMSYEYSYFIDLVEKHIPKKGTILDAGCGTGNILKILLEKGYNVYGVDLSSEMLSVLEDKLRKNQLYTKLYEQSLEESLGINQYTGIVSFLDVLNYIKDYKIVFKNIYEALVNDGVFLFDVHPVKYINSMAGYVEEEEIDNFSYYWEVIKGNEENSIIHKLKINTPLKNYYEEHFQKTYPIEEYISSLKEIGFKNVEILEETDEYKIFVKAVK